MTVKQLETYLFKNIPISSALGVKVEAASLDHVVLSAPFINNINHKKTVFGGSLHAVATLACWSLLHLNLTKLFSNNFQIVIANSNVDYLAPVSQDFKVECNKPPTTDWEWFIKTFEKKGKARLKITATINQQDTLCVDYAGTFVALRHKTEG